MDNLNIQQTRRRRAGFKAVQPIKTQESLFAEEKSKAVHYGGFYRQVLQTSENYTSALVRFCVRLDVIKKRVQFFEGLQISKDEVENQIIWPIEFIPFYDSMDDFWAGKRFMPIYEIKELKRERILNILAEEQKELEHYVRTLVERCTL